MCKLDNYGFASLKQWIAFNLIAILFASSASVGVETFAVLTVA